MFKEALLVCMLTGLDSQMSIMKKIIEEDADNQDFTSHYNFFRTPIYKKRLDGVNQFSSRCHFCAMAIAVGYSLMMVPNIELITVTIFIWLNT